MNHEEVLAEMQERIDRGEPSDTILSWLESIGTIPNPQDDRGYEEASMAAVASNLATFYMTLRESGITRGVATKLTVTFLSNVQSKFDHD